MVGKRNFGGHLHQWEPWLARRGKTQFLVLFLFHSLFSLISYANEHIGKSTCCLSHLKIWYPFVGDCDWFDMQ